MTGEIYEVGSRTKETIEVVNRIMARTEWAHKIKLGPWKEERRFNSKGELLYIYSAECFRDPA